MTKNIKKKKRKKANKYIHIVNTDSDSDSEKPDFIVNANNPLSAAKKIWKVNKHLEKIYLKDINTNEEFIYNASQWLAKNGDKKFD